MNAASRLRVVFFGTSPFAVPSLRAIAEDHDIAAVVTQPERPAGRGLQIRASAVSIAAREARLPVIAPERLDPPFVERIAALRPHLLACASYGKIIPPALLAIEGMAALNVHPSLLPLYRGAAPIQAALRDGQTATGVTIFWMTPEMDAGDIALQARVTIAPDDDFGSLHDRLAIEGARLLREAALLLARDALPRRPQDRAAATFTRPVRKDDLRIVEGQSAARIVDLVRSASPSPAAWTIFDGKRLKVLKARVESSDAAPVSADGPSLRAADGIVRLLRVVPEGKRAMSGAEFARTIAPRP